MRSATLRAIGTVASRSGRGSENELSLRRHRGTSGETFAASPRRLGHHRVRPGSKSMSAMHAARTTEERSTARRWNRMESPTSPQPRLPRTCATSHRRPLAPLKMRGLLRPQGGAAERISTVARSSIASFRRSPRVASPADGLMLQEGTFTMSWDWTGGCADQAHRHLQNENGLPRARARDGSEDRHAERDEPRVRRGSRWKRR